MYKWNQWSIKQDKVNLKQQRKRQKEKRARRKELEKRNTNSRHLISEIENTYKL